MTTGFLLLSMVGRWSNANEQHVLDWYHIARRFEAIGKSLIYLPDIEDFGYRLGRHWGHLNRAKWKVWHGNVYGAYVALTCFLRRGRYPHNARGERFTSDDEP